MREVIGIKCTASCDCVEEKGYNDFGTNSQLRHCIPPLDCTKYIKYVIVLNEFIQERNKCFFFL